MCKKNQTIVYILFFLKGIISFFRTSLDTESSDSGTGKTGGVDNSFDSGGVINDVGKGVISSSVGAILVL
jgi:hypothetical protein